MARENYYVLIWQIKIRFLNLQLKIEDFNLWRIKSECVKTLTKQNILQLNFWIQSLMNINIKKLYLWNYISKKFGDLMVICILCYPACSAGHPPGWSSRPRGPGAPRSWVRWVQCHKCLSYHRVLFLLLPISRQYCFEINKSKTLIDAVLTCSNSFGIEEVSKCLQTF